MSLGITAIPIQSRNMTLRFISPSIIKIVSCGNVAIPKLVHGILLGCGVDAFEPH